MRWAGSDGRAHRYPEDDLRHPGRHGLQVAGSLLLKPGDTAPAVLAADRSMAGAIRSDGPPAAAARVRALAYSRGPAPSLGTDTEAIGPVEPSTWPRSSSSDVGLFDEALRDAGVAAASVTACGAAGANRLVDVVKTLNP